MRRIWAMTTLVAAAADVTVNEGIIQGLGLGGKTDWQLVDEITFAEGGSGGTAPFTVAGRGVTPVQSVALGPWAAFLHRPYTSLTALSSAWVTGSPMGVCGKFST